MKKLLRDRILEFLEEQKGYVSVNDITRVLRSSRGGTGNELNILRREGKVKRRIKCLDASRAPLGDPMPTMRVNKLNGWIIVREDDN